MFDAYNRGDMRAVLSVVAPEVKVVPAGVFAQPGVTYHGVSGFESLMAHLASSHTNLRFEATGFKAVGNVTVVYVAGSAPDGTRELIMVISFNRGTIHRIEAFTSEPQALAAAERAQAPRTRLTPREREVFAMLAEGLTGAEIADRLFLSRETVRTHIQNGTARMGAKTRVEAVVRAVAGGEIPS
jgi:DNA-binding CsgD family transcriptional regulator